MIPLLIPTIVLVLTPPACRQVVYLALRARPTGSLGPQPTSGGNTIIGGITNDSVVIIGNNIVVSSKINIVTNNIDVVTSNNGNVNSSNIYVTNSNAGNIITNSNAVITNASTSVTGSNTNTTKSSVITTTGSDCTTTGSTICVKKSSEISSFCCLFISRSSVIVLIMSYISPPVPYSVL